MPCVHTRHCTYSYCKYGEEDYCPVYLGYEEPEQKTSEDGFEFRKPTKKEFEHRRNQVDSLFME